jgi:hypothetical protein
MAKNVLTIVAACIAAVVACGLVSAAPAADAKPRTVSSKVLLAHLTTAREHPAGYKRSLFRTWVDANHDGCNTRAEVLITEAKKRPRIGRRCRLSHGRWVSPYDGMSTTNPSRLDIDHLVPLAEAWQSGAWRWAKRTRTAYGNDLGYAADLIAVSAHANRSKGQKEPFAYLPPRRKYDCAYTAHWVAVKWRWRLSVDGHEKKWLRKRLAHCRWPRVARPSRPKIAHRKVRVRAKHKARASASGARITRIYFDSPGPDYGSTKSLNGEWVAIRNTTRTGRNLTGWTLRDRSRHLYTFGRFVLAARKTVKIHSGRGRNTKANLHWRRAGRGGYIWNNTGDTAVLRNAAGKVIDRCSYSRSDDPSAVC